MRHFDFQSLTDMTDTYVLPDQDALSQLPASDAGTDDIEELLSQMGYNRPRRFQGENV